MTGYRSRSNKNVAWSQQHLSFIRDFNCALGVPLWSISLWYLLIGCRNSVGTDRQRQTDRQKERVVIKRNTSRQFYYSQVSITWTFSPPWQLDPPPPDTHTQPHTDCCHGNHWDNTSSLLTAWSVSPFELIVFHIWSFLSFDSEELNWNQLRVEERMKGSWQTRWAQLKRESPLDLGEQYFFFLFFFLTANKNVLWFWYSR